MRAGGVRGMGAFRSVGIDETRSKRRTTSATASSFGGVFPAYASPARVSTAVSAGTGPSECSSVSIGLVAVVVFPSAPVLRHSALTRACSRVAVPVLISSRGYADASRRLRYSRSTYWPATNPRGRNRRCGRFGRAPVGLALIVVGAVQLERVLAHDAHVGVALSACVGGYVAYSRFRQRAVCIRTAGGAGVTRPRSTRGSVEFSAHRPFPDSGVYSRWASPSGGAALGCWRSRRESAPTRMGVRAVCRDGAGRRWSAAKTCRVRRYVGGVPSLRCGASGERAAKNTSCGVAAAVCPALCVATPRLVSPDAMSRHEQHSAAHKITRRTKRPNLRLFDGRE